jgi:hypothetical protein
MKLEQEAFLVRARARLRELEALHEEARQSLTTDDFAEVNREVLVHLDDIHGAMTQVMRGQPATLNARPATRYTVYRLDVAGGRWLRVLTVRDMPTAVRHLIELQSSGEIAHLVAWLTVSERAAQEQDVTRFRPPLSVEDAGDHIVRM